MFVEDRRSCVDSHIKESFLWVFPRFAPASQSRFWQCAMHTALYYLYHQRFRSQQLLRRLISWLLWEPLVVLYINNLSPKNTVWSYLIKQAVWWSIPIRAFSQQLPTFSRTSDIAVDQMTAAAWILIRIWKLQWELVIDDHCGYMFIPLV